MLQNVQDVGGIIIRQKVKKMNKQKGNLFKSRKIKFILLMTIGFMIVNSFLTPIKTQSDSIDTVSGRIEVSVDSEDEWEATQWIFYKTTCDFEENVKINLSYTGELDLDMWVFIDLDTDGGPEEQKNFATDLTNCPFDEEPKLHSSKKVYNTTAETGPEMIYYENNEKVNERVLYILVFAHSGVGNSTYSLNSTNNISEVNNVRSCNTEIIAWTIFGAGLVFLYGLVIKIAKNRAKSEKEKKKEKKMKIKKKTKKRRKSLRKKGKTSMSERRGSRRR